MLRSGVLSLYRRVLRRRSRRWGADELRRPAVVISPHFDDETLGCGGTILQKRRAGAAVAVVFMTDGSNSHRALMSPDELRRIRSAEGLAAGRVLGLGEGDVYEFGFEEGRLREHEAAAADRIVQLLGEREPEEVYIPYQGEPLLWSEDHRATTRAARAALARWGRRTTVYEYPIWFYRQWPWTQWGGTGWEKKVYLKLAPRSPLGLGVLRGLPCWRDTTDVLEQKCLALAEHRSQMYPLVAGGVWKTLSDVAGGSFLECFLCGYELFHPYGTR